MTAKPKELVALRKLVTHNRVVLQAARAHGLPIPTVKVEWLRKASAALAEAESRWLEAEHGTGCVKAGKCRETGTTVQLYAPGTQDLDEAGEGSDEPGWFVVCCEHDSCVTVGYRKMGEYLVSHPTEFCDDCRELVGGTAELALRLMLQAERDGVLAYRGGRLTERRAMPTHASVYHFLEVQMNVAGTLLRAGYARVVEGDVIELTALGRKLAAKGAP
jgi:hypothetical protein